MGDRDAENDGKVAIMEKRLRIEAVELSRMALECQCGTTVELDTASAYAAPQQCPCCGAVFSQEVVGLAMAALRNGFRNMAKLAEQGAFPRVAFLLTSKAKE